MACSTCRPSALPLLHPQWCGEDDRFPGALDRWWERRPICFGLHVLAFSRLAVLSIALLTDVSGASAASKPVHPKASSAHFPTAATTGVGPDWKPITTYTADLVVNTPGAVIEDVRLVNADLLVDADNVTLRRIELQGGRIANDPDGVCRNGLMLEDVSLIRAPGQVTSDTDEPAIGPGGYTARRVKIDGLPEGFRVGGRSIGCDEVTIEDSFARIVAPDECTDWHGDGIQGYDGPKLTLRNVALYLVERRDCSGTAPFFYPARQGNTSVDIDRLLVSGGGFPFRLDMPGSVRGLRIVKDAGAPIPPT